MDIDVLVKRTSEGQHLPYRKFNLDLLGAICPIKTKNTYKDEMSTSNEDENGFKTPVKGTGWGNEIPKEVIFQNIKELLDGFNRQ